jgi:hypothetical protein
VGRFATSTNVLPTPLEPIQAKRQNRKLNELT